MHSMGGFLKIRFLNRTNVGMMFQFFNCSGLHSQSQKLKRSETVNENQEVELIY